MTIAEKYAQQWLPNGEVSLADLIQAALDEQAEAFKGELQAYDGMVRELKKTVEDMQAAQTVPVVGEPAGYFPDESRADEIDAPPLPVYFAPTHSIPAAELATLRELAKTVEDMQAAQAVPVVGEPTDAAYKWMIANGVEPLTSLHKLGERLAAFLDEDQFSGCETLLLTAITAINTFVPVPAAELASLREKAAELETVALSRCADRIKLSRIGQERDELRKDAERYRWVRRRIDANFILEPSQEDIDEEYELIVDDAIDAAIAQGRTCGDERACVNCYTGIGECIAQGKGE